MKKSSPLLTTLAACTFSLLTLTSREGRAEGVSPPLSPVADAPANQIAPGNDLLAKAAAQLERRASVTARLRHQVALDGQQLYGVGSYWQQGTGEALKVRLELQIAGQEAQLLQVCNARFMWLDRRLPTGRTVSRIDLRQLRADPSIAAGNLDEIKPGQANWSSLQSELTAYTGGLPTVLAALSENFDFMPPLAMRLAITPPLATEPTSMPVFAVVGHWKPDRIAALLSKAQANGETPPADDKKKKPLPERMPEEVLLLVGQADWFPYRIEYRRLETPRTTADGPQIPYQLSVHPMVVLELSDVVFDSQIAPGQFDYMPGDADWVDQTNITRDRLRQERQAQVATRPTDQPVPSRQ